MGDFLASVWLVLNAVFVVAWVVVAYVLPLVLLL
jgi:hypothetical protein